MAVNTGKSFRSGAVKNRVQVKNPNSGRWVKLDTKTGKILDVKSSRGPFKGVVQKHKDAKRST